MTHQGAVSCEVWDIRCSMWPYRSVRRTANCICIFRGWGRDYRDFTPRGRRLIRDEEGWSAEEIFSRSIHRIPEENVIDKIARDEEYNKKESKKEE